MSQPIIDCAREHVACLGALVVLNDSDLETHLMDAVDALAEVLDRAISPAERFALSRACRYEARRVAEDLLNDDTQPEAWGVLRQTLEHALDRDADSLATCDECEGRGFDANGDRCCFGGLVVPAEAVTGLAKKLRDDALAALGLAKVPLVEVETAPAEAEVAA